MGKGDWYYNLNTHQVEPYEANREEDRLGPYKTREEAEHAMERFHERQEQWDTDPRFNDPEELSEDEAKEKAIKEWEVSPLNPTVDPDTPIV